MRKSFFIGLIVGIYFLSSCSKQPDSLELQSQNHSSPLSYVTSELPIGDYRDGDNSTKMVIGQDRGIPLSLRNMRNAARFIDSTTNQGLIAIVPTHYYVQFTPTTEEHLTILDSLSDVYALFNYPIQNAVVSEGSFLSTSNSTQNKFDPLYASYPVGDALPAVPYRVLDTLFDPADDQLDLVVVSYVLTDNADQLGIKYNGEYLTTSTLNDYLELSLSTRAAGDYYPEGVLKVKGDKGEYEPVSNTKLQIVRWGIPYPAYTDEGGYFRFSKKMRGEVLVRATWRNGDYVIRKSWNEMLGIAVSDAVCYINKGCSGSNNVIKIERDDSHLWYKATVSNAVYNYNKTMEARGVAGLHNNANIWVMVSDTSVGGSAPMAKKYAWAVTNNALLSSWLSFITPNAYPIVNSFNLLFRNLYPDITLSYDENATTKKVENLLFHEAGHYSHGIKAGGDFWGEFVRYEVGNIVNNSNHNPYQDGTKPSVSAGRMIALCEGWADFCRYVVLDARGINVTTDIENYTMRTTPSMLNDLVDNYSMNFWFLSGLMWDIVDNAPETSSKLVDGITGEIENYIVDNLQIGSKNNLAPIYNCLTSNTKSGYQLKSKLNVNHPSKQTKINELFTSYGY